MQTNPVLRYSAQGGGGGPTPQWETNWSAATGGGTTALGDGGKWDEISGRAEDMFAGVQGGQVVTTGAIDFPTANAYRGLLYAACDPCVRNSDDVTAITNPAVGEYVHYRWYVRVQSEDGVNIGIMHWWHWGGITPYHELVAIGTMDGPGSLEFGLWMNIQGGTVRRITTQLDPNTTYRLTIGLRRHATDEARVQYMKLYDTDNTLLVDTGDWTVEGGGTLTNLAMNLYSIPSQIFRRFQIGPNDSLVSGYSGPTNFLYHSGVAALGSANADDELGPL